MKKTNYLEILNICNNKGKVSVEELVDIMDLSPSTIRRVIKKLSDDGVVKRYHGGIYSKADANVVLPFEQRSDLYKNEKIKIALKAASFIDDNMVILVDTGTTCSYIADYIKAKNLIVFTNGIEIIKPLMKKQYHVCVPPGQIVQRASTYIDFVQSLEYLDAFTFDIAFIGTNAIHESTGFACPNASHAAILKKMVSRSKKVYILADHSKFGILNSYTFAKYDECTVITDKRPESGFENFDIIVTDDN